MTHQGEPGDPMWEGLWSSGRFEHAFVWMAGGLAAGYIPALFFVDKAAMLVGPKATAVVFALFSFGLPLFSFRGWSRERAGVGTALATGAMALGVWLTTGAVWLTLAASALALGGALQAYRIYKDTDLRPQMMQAAIDRARADAALRKQTKQER